jgi:aryl-alcohol dehydrogenase-like predicted oxidoreductase
MKYRTLGRTGLIVSEVGFGAWALGSSQSGSTDDATALKAIAKAVELGCNFFDTADVYGLGHSEEIVGQGLAEIGKLNEVIIATKVGGSMDDNPVSLTEDYIRNALQNSLKRLRRDYIDLYQLHNPYRQIIVQGQVFDIFEKLKQEGLIRHYGVTVHNVAEGIAALKNGKPETIQIVYNMYSLIQSHNPAEQLFPSAKEENVGIITREPLANGFLTGKIKQDTVFSEGDVRGSWQATHRSFKLRITDALRFLEQPNRTMSQASLRFVLDEPFVSTCVVGIKTPKQAEENLSASTIPALTETERQKINTVFFG